MRPTPTKGKVSASQTQRDPGAPHSDTPKVEREARQLSYQVVELEVRRRFAQLDGDNDQVEEAVRRIGELKARRRELFIGREEPEEDRYFIASREEFCLELESDRIQNRIGELIHERRNAIANGDTARGGDLDGEILALEERRDSVYSLFYGTAEGSHEPEC